MLYKLSEPSYAYDALEPYYDKATVKILPNVHHKVYIDGPKIQFTASALRLKSMNHFLKVFIAVAIIIIGVGLMGVLIQMQLVIIQNQVLELAQMM
ncbi:MAG: hypothetical protein P4L49_17675 [Desulfosporosinus sp.]|nr:hypothetical protein [Desulfosporosinus sp.]